MSHLETLEPLIGIIAAERTGERASRYDDARQEGLIRAWLVEQERPDAPREYVLAAARRGVADTLRGRASFGAASHRGRQDAADSATPFSQNEERDDDTLLSLVDMASVTALEGAETADVGSMLRRIISRLPEADRSVIFDRFWRDMTWAEVAASRGRSANAVRVRFHNHIAAAIRTELTLAA